MLINYKKNPLLATMNNFILGKTPHVELYSQIIKDDYDPNAEGEYTVLYFDKDSDGFQMIDENIDPQPCVEFLKEISTNKFCKNRYLCHATGNKIEPALNKIDKAWLYKLNPQKGVIHLQDHSIAYSIEATEDPEVKKFYTYTFYNEFNLVGLKVSGTLTKQGIIDYDFTGIKTKRELTEDSLILSFPIVLLFFFDFAEVETLITGPRNRKVKIAKEKYLNETNQIVEIINSSYFTTLIMKGEFAVTGHWRWQPTGSRENPIPKLIWINEYKKEGYTRIAKKQINETKV